MELNPQNSSWIRGKFLGKGSYGTVSLGFRDNGEGGDSINTVPAFAVKSAMKGCIASIEALENEIDILRSISSSSPFIVDYYGDSETTSCRELFIEYLPGGDVAGGGKKVADVELIRSYTWCLVSALREVHANGIVHCDVKGSNVLVENRVAKLADFGSAKQAVDDQDGVLPRGSPLWWAPEVVRGEAQGCESDVWALGCTVIEMFTGLPAWQDNGAHTLYKIGYCNELPEFAARLPELGRDFLEKCLVREAGQRWSCDQLLEHPFLVPVVGGVVWEVSPRSVFDLGEWVGFSDDEGDVSEGEIGDEEVRVLGRGRIGELEGGVGVFWESDGWVEVRSVREECVELGEGEEVIIESSIGANSENQNNEVVEEEAEEEAEEEEEEEEEDTTWIKLISTEMDDLEIEELISGRDDDGWPQLAGTTQDHLQIFNIDAKAKIKYHQKPEIVVFWKWITPKILGLVTQSSVYHWSIEGGSEPLKMFERIANLVNNQIINYRCDPLEKWLVLIVIAPGPPERPQLVKGNMQLYSVDQQCSQALEAHAAAFAQWKVQGNENPSTLICFATKTSNAGQVTSKLHVIELGAQTERVSGKPVFSKKQAGLFFPPDFADDFPVSMQISQKYGLIYVITKLGLLFVYDLETVSAIYRNRISPDPIFLTSEASSAGGFYAVNRRGQVLLATVNEATIVPFISGQLNLELAVNLAKRGNLPGAENLVVQRFQELFPQTKYKEAAELAAESPQGILRTPDTVAKFQSVPVQAGQTPPLLQYFATLLIKGKLNSFESLELSRLLVNQNKKILLENWFAEDKLECSEELGDLIKTVDTDFALKIYIKATVTPKVVAAFAERSEFDKILIYPKQVGYTPGYLFLLQTILRTDPQGAVNFALMMPQMDGGFPLDYNTITDLFFQRNLIREATAFLLDVLKPNLPEHGHLQTKVLETNLVTFPNVADAILANGMFSHYDRARVAQLCEKAGLYLQALKHYSELSDIKRVIVNTHAIEPQELVEFFGTLLKEWALECMKDLLVVNPRGNLQIIVQVAKEYCEQLGVDGCMKLFEQFRSYDGMYFFLGSNLSSSEDPEIHFKYIEAAAKTGQIKEVERVTRESNFYDPEKTKNFLMEAKLPDARPLINGCDRFGFVPDLTHYLYTNNMLRYIEGYVEKVNPGNAPLVVGQLLDDECPEDFIKGLILSVRSLLPVEFLVEECEKRNRLRLLTQFLKHLISEGSTDVHVHNALGKIIIDSNNNPEHFLTTNPYYDSRVVGKYCEKRDPILAVMAYQRGLCDNELVIVTNKNSLFKLQARYVVEIMDGELWEKVLSSENEYKRQLIDQVVSTSLPESKSPEQVSAAVKAFMTADLPHELIELLEKIVLQNSAFSGNSNLQNLLILTAIKADASRVMDYINRLDNFDGRAVGEVAVEAQLYEEAFAIFKKFCSRE
ncbi:hypothetical protein KSS87_005977 [Heliosperma pusillum]|nr:hypothetical protein KSS87_005977 [Heliosperma pusillum]